MYSFLKNAVLLFYKIFFRVEVVGQENIPKGTSAIICPNHKSNHDPVIVVSYTHRQISFMAKDSLFRIPIVGYVFRKIGTFPVKRGTGDIGAVRKAIEILKNNNVLCIFPEGKRNFNGELSEFKHGAALIAYKSDTPIVPCAIVGKYRIFSKIKIVFMKPVFINSKEGKPNLDEITQNIKRQISIEMEKGIK